jgi:hypothetical protein
MAHRRLDPPCFTGAVPIISWNLRDDPGVPPATGRGACGAVTRREPLFTSSYVFSETYTALLVQDRSTVAFAFDRHFEQRGLQVIPSPAM